MFRKVVSFLFPPNIDSANLEATNMDKKYCEVNENQLARFIVIPRDGTFLLKMKDCPNTITIKLPFILDENVAMLAGMMPDGSLIKDLRRIYFTQKKDFRKIEQFKYLMEILFKPNNKIFIRNGHNAFESYTNSTVLVHFLYHLLDFKKSDEQIRIPVWIFNSPDSVKRAYIKEAFSMEGTIFKSLKELRYITKSHNYALDLQKLLLSLEINSFVRERIAGTPKTIQYRISVYRKENFEKFKEIGFTLPMHVERFQLICKKYGI